ncbi:Glucans biosynthesis protein G precursor [Rubripirellula lacrimiformis]|uniref:Glucans biosynthesis protein G n=1 Tax=Rubripirellula lacrimiformis TaxID=1930273 RepID=A0A517N535_9BACT|nr:glucan biosynthesis protein [Rubripirellula lacrimiformis]QDT02244.1 Glucans biosynthesis protein G precursor [Rubripirellula lacrimiformis]
MFRIFRLIWIASFLLAGSVADAEDPQTISQYTDVHDFDDLIMLAESAAKNPVAPTPELPELLASWQYDDYIKTSYKSDRATWFNQGLPFWLETFHRGFVQVDLVDVFTLSPLADGDAVCQRVKFSKDDFTYAAPLDPATIPSAGHAGLKVVGQFPGRSDAEEMLSFLGSSYFRSRSADCVYGASARGLAINIGMKATEEFPDFRAFWVRMPTRDSKDVTVLAHLDSPSVSGAYEFRLTPGDRSTEIHVDAKLFFRDVPDKVALAPLTSMWIWGDGLAGPPKDARPSVHDSDGLLIQSGIQQWSWRAFARQDYPSVTSTEVEAVHGFGLIQRNRAFYHYDDHNARYDKRPSVWVTPDSPWTSGRIGLLELPGAHEGVDNLAAYWLPPSLPESGEPLSIGYTVEFFAGDPPAHNLLARATNFAVDRGQQGDPIEIEVRFAGMSLRTLPESVPPRIQADVLRGQVTAQKVTRTETGDWLLTATVIPAEDAPVELAWQLFSGDDAVSEEFRYLLPPSEPEFVYPAVYTRQE